MFQPKQSFSYFIKIYLIIISVLRLKNVWNNLDIQRVEREIEIIKNFSAVSASNKFTAFDKK